MEEILKEVKDDGENKGLVMVQNFTTVETHRDFINELISPC